MDNKKILMIGGICAVVVWGGAILMSWEGNDSKEDMFPRHQDEEVSTGTPISNPVENGASPLASQATPDLEPATGTEVEPLYGNASPKLASSPAKEPKGPALNFHCKGEICVDAETGTILSGKNIDVQSPPASVTKLLTLYVVLDAIETGRIALNDKTTISRRAQNMGGTQIFLAEGEVCVIQDLLYALMLESANDAAVALAEACCGNVEKFVEIMNREAQKLGMKKSKFTTPHGLPPSKKERAAGVTKDLTCAEDLAKLSVALLKRFPNALQYSSQNIRAFPANIVRKSPLNMRNHNTLLWNDKRGKNPFPGCDGLKTGWTSDGASIVTTASRGNKRVIAVVLGGLVKNKKGEIDAKSSQAERNKLAAKLMFSGLKQLDSLQYEPTPYQ